MRYAHPTIVCTNLINAIACFCLSFALVTLVEDSVALLTGAILTCVGLFDLYVAVLVYKAMQ